MDLIVCHTYSVTNAHYFHGLLQDCSNSVANALELLQSCTEPSIKVLLLYFVVVRYWPYDCFSVHELIGPWENWIRL